MVTFQEWLAASGCTLDIRYCVRGEHPSGQAIWVWEDEWNWKGPIVRSRIRSKMGSLTRVPARLGVIRRIAQPEAHAFLEQHHLQGATVSKFKYGLFLPQKHYRYLQEPPAEDEILMAVMTFSGPRTFRDGSKSYELIRFAVRCDYHMQGGFSKLLQHFIKDKEPDSIMTYVDRNWYTGNAYASMGFAVVDELPPIRYKFETGGKRVQAKDEVHDAMNKGSLKMVWTKQS